MGVFRNFVNSAEYFLCEVLENFGCAENGLSLVGTLEAEPRWPKGTLQKLVSGFKGIVQDISS